MSRLVWNPRERPYYTGVERGVLYLPDNVTVPWNGLVSIEEKAPGNSGKRIYVDGKNVGMIYDRDDFVLGVSAYTYPDAFSPFTGYDDIFDKQPRATFGMSYRVGDSELGLIHLVYNATAFPQAETWKTLSNQTEIELFNWDIETKPFEFEGIAPTAHLVIDLALLPQSIRFPLEDVIYGSPGQNAILPDLPILFQIFEDNATFKVTDHGDGTWTVEGPDSMVHMLDATTFEIISPTVVYIDAETYTVSTSY